ncbi:MAG: hypothetical protein IT258_14765, partial [Saprospiraceae bacterium]|nr:hypothetical protein [Saprospiraceae bacterium]
MKRLIATIACLVTLTTANGQTEWAPVGMKWWVLVQIGFDLQEFYNTYECT